MACLCDKYNARMLRTPCEFQSETPADDGAGGRTTLSWAAVSGAPTRCHYDQKGGAEVWRNDRLNAEVVVRIVTRYNSGITEKMRVSIGGKVHNIRSLNNVEMKNRWLEIKLDAGVAT